MEINVNVRFIRVFISGGWRQCAVTPTWRWLLNYFDCLDRDPLVFSSWGLDTMPTSVVVVKSARVLTVLLRTNVPMNGSFMSK